MKIVVSCNLTLQHYYVLPVIFSFRLVLSIADFDTDTISLKCNVSVCYCLSYGGYQKCRPNCPILSDGHAAMAKLEPLVQNTKHLLQQ